MCSRRAEGTASTVAEALIMISTPNAPEHTFYQLGQGPEPTSPTVIRYHDDAEVTDLSITTTGVAVTLRRRSNMMYACNPPRPIPDAVWREVYEARAVGGDVVLELTKVEHGKHTPAAQVPESISFDT